MWKLLRKMHQLSRITNSSYTWDIYIILIASMNKIQAKTCSNFKLEMKEISQNKATFRLQKMKWKKANVDDSFSEVVHHLLELFVLLLVHSSWTPSSACYALVVVEVQFLNLQILGRSYIWCVCDMSYDSLEVRVVLSLFEFCSHHHCLKEMNPKVGVSTCMGSQLVIKS